MRFTLIKDLKQDSLMKPILSGLLIFTLLYLVSDIVVKYFSFGIFPDAINLTLFGDEEQFLDPLTKSSFLEFWHMEIFFIMMILLTLSAVFIRLASDDIHKIVIINLVMLLSIISLISILLAFFISKSFVEIYAVSFLSWHILAMYMALYSLWALYNEKSI